MAGNINISPNLNLSPFNPQGEVAALTEVSRQQAAQNINNQNNFTSRINNALTNVAAAQRNQVQQDALMQRQIQQQVVDSINAAEENKLKLKSETDKETREAQRFYSSEDNFNNSLAKSIETATNLGLTGDNFKNFMANSLGGYLASENPGIRNLAAQATGNIISPQEINPATQAKINPQQPVVAGTNSLLDTITSTVGDNISLSQQKAKFDLKKSELDNIAKSLENQEDEAKLKALEAAKMPITLEETAAKIASVRGREATPQEASFYNGRDEARKQLKLNEDGLKQFVKGKEEFIKSTSNIAQIVDNVSSLDQTISEARSLGISIDPNGADVMRMGLERLLAAKDSEASQEVLDSMKAANIFKFPPGTSEATKKKLKNSYLTSVNQIMANSSFLARRAGNTGVLTAKDVAFALQKYFSTSGDIDQFQENLQKGLGSTLAEMTNDAYYYEDDQQFAAWGKVLDESGYAINEFGVAVDTESGQPTAQAPAPSILGEPNLEQDMMVDSVVSNKYFSAEEQAELEELEAMEAAGAFNQDPISQQLNSVLMESAQAKDQTDIQKQFNILDQKDNEIVNILKGLGLK